MSIEILGQGVLREYLHEGRIVAYKVVGGGQEISDTWAEAMIAEIRAWDTDQAYLTLQDMSQAGISPYGKKRTDDIAASFPPELTAYIAVVLGSNPLARFMRLFIRTIDHMHRDSQVKYQFFTDRANALRWLEMQLELKPNR